MPGYDPDKDKKIKEWKNEETGLLISIQQYGEGEPKVQIGPRILKKKTARIGPRPRQEGCLWKISCGCTTLSMR